MYLSDVDRNLTTDKPSPGPHLTHVCIYKYMLDLVSRGAHQSADKLHMRSRRNLGIYPREETMDVADDRSPRSEVAAPSYLSPTRSSYCGEIAIWLAISPHCCCIIARLMGMGSSVDSSRKMEGELRGGFRPFLHWCAAFLPFALESRRPLIVRSTDTVWPEFIHPLSGLG